VKVNNRELLKRAKAGDKFLYAPKTKKRGIAPTPQAVTLLCYYELIDRARVQNDDDGIITIIASSRLEKI